MQGALLAKRYQKLRQEAGAICIQKNVRMWLARKRFLANKDAVARTQTGCRRMASRKEIRFRRQTKAATIIQVQEMFVVRVCSFCSIILVS